MLGYIVIYISIGFIAGLIGDETDEQKNWSYGLIGISLLISFLTAGGFVIAAAVEIFIGFIIAKTIKEKLGFSANKENTSFENDKEDHKTKYNNTNNIYCGNCGSSLSSDEIFCGKCGTKTINESYNPKKEYEKVLYSYNGITIALLSKLAKIDGRVSENEANYIRTLITKFSLNKIDFEIKDIREVYKKIVKEEKDKTFNLTTLCTVGSKYIKTFKLKKEITERLLYLAHIDADYSLKEKEFIFKILKLLEIEEYIYLEVMKKYKKEEKFEERSNTKESFNGRLTLLEAYETLNLSQNATNSEIKKQYRKLAREYHYDSLTSKGLPKDLIDFAEEKLKMINAAYALLKENKGI